jgi:hypothetical protein
MHPRLISLAHLGLLGFMLTSVPLKAICIVERLEDQFARSSVIFVGLGQLRKAIHVPSSGCWSTPQPSTPQPRKSAQPPAESTVRRPKRAMHLLPLFQTNTHNLLFIRRNNSS